MRPLSTLADSLHGHGDGVSVCWPTRSDREVVRAILVMRIEVHKTDIASTFGLGKSDRNKAVECANIVDFVAGEPKRRFWCRHAVHTVGIRNVNILEMRVCTRPVSVMAKHAIPDTEKKSGRVQLSKDHAKRHVDVSTIKMYKLGRIKSFYFAICCTGPVSLGHLVVPEPLGRPGRTLRSGYSRC